jgi:hypothetical protein
MQVSRLFPIALFILLAGCGYIYRYVTSGPVGWAIKQEIRDNNKTEISLAKLTRFSWDEVIVFGAYTPRDEVCRRLQLDEPQCQAADLPDPSDDGLNLLVFRQNGRIVHHEIHFAYHGEFRVEEKSLSPQDARFVVEPQGALSNGERQLILRRQAPPTPATSSARQSP